MKFIVNLDRDETGMIVTECPAIPGWRRQEPVLNIPWQRRTTQDVPQGVGLNGKPKLHASLRIKVVIPA